MHQKKLETSAVGVMNNHGLGSRVGVGGGMVHMGK